MTVNYYLQCPSCGCVTRMRSPAGYIERNPVRIHCGNCNTLLTGEFISNSKTGTCTFIPGNCGHLEPCNYDYYGEASGEVLCHKICQTSTSSHFSLSPSMIAMRCMDLEICEKYIDYACHITKLKSNWDTRVILYNLFLNEKYNLLKEKYNKDADIWDCDLSKNHEIQRYVNLEYIYDFGMIFGSKVLEEQLIKINYEIIHLNKEKLKEYIDFLRRNNKIKETQNKMFSIMKNYIDIALYIMPALSTTFYKDESLIDKCNYGITTCSFLDIKNFYLDSFEALASCCDVIKCLDNVKYRSSFNDFGSKMDVEKFNNHTNNGNRIKELNKCEFFSSVFGLSDTSSYLRNAIGHNEYEYDGITQKLIYTPNNQQQDKKQTTYLLDIATNCIDLMKSSIVLEFIVYELFRESHRDQFSNLRIHPFFYKKTNNNNHCPCGSGKKYRKCCKDWVLERKKHIRKFDLPSNSNMRFSPKTIMDYLKKSKNDI